jgi:hypothetical protein
VVQLGVAGHRHDLRLAGLLQPVHRDEGFADGAPRGEQAVVAQDHRGVSAQVAHEALLLVEVDRRAFIVVVPDVAEEHRILRERQQAALERRDGHAGGRVGVDHAVDVMARLVHGAVDHEAGQVDAVAGARIQHQLAVEVDLDQARGGDFLVGVAVGVDEEVAVLARHAPGYVVVDEVVHAEQRDQAVAGRDVHAHLPFLRAHLAAQGRNADLR